MELRRPPVTVVKSGTEIITSGRIPTIARLLVEFESTLPILRHAEAPVRQKPQAATPSSCSELAGARIELARSDHVRRHSPSMLGKNSEVRTAIRGTTVTRDRVASSSTREVLRSAMPMLEHRSPGAAASDVPACTRAFQIGEGPLVIDRAVQAGLQRPAELQARGGVVVGT